VKLVHLVGFIIKKFVTMHGHMTVQINWMLSSPTRGNADNAVLHWLPCRGYW